MDHEVVQVSPERFAIGLINATKLTNQSGDLLACAKGVFDLSPRMRIKFGKINEIFGHADIVAANRHGSFATPVAVYSTVISTLPEWLLNSGAYMH